MKDLTICVRTYKENTQMLEKCLLSISKQKNIEQSQILIYNDGCNNDVLNTINKFCLENPQLNIFIFYRNKRIGAANSLKELYKLVKTDYMIFCDGDDEYVKDDGLDFAITKLKEQNLEFINCDDGNFKLHQMTIFLKNIINEKLFINFSKRHDEYMSYIYNFRNGMFLDYPFYKWNRKYSNQQLHFVKMDNDETKLWNIYSDLVNKRITKYVAKNQLNIIENTTQYLYIYSSLIELLKSDLF